MNFTRKHLEILRPKSFTDWAILLAAAAMIFYGIFK